MLETQKLPHSSFQSEDIINSELTCRQENCHVFFNFIYISKVNFISESILLTLFYCVIIAGRSFLLRWIARGSIKGGIDLIQQTATGNWLCACLYCDINILG